MKSWRSKGKQNVRWFGLKLQVTHSTSRLGPGRLGKENQMSEWWTYCAGSVVVVSIFFVVAYRVIAEDPAYRRVSAHLSPNLKQLLPPRLEDYSAEHYSPDKLVALVAGQRPRPVHLRRVEMPTGTGGADDSAWLSTPSLTSDSADN